MTLIIGKDRIKYIIGSSNKYTNDSITLIHLYDFWGYTIMWSSLILIGKVTFIYKSCYLVFFQSKKLTKKNGQQNRNEGENGSICLITLSLLN